MSRKRKERATESLGDHLGHHVRLTGHHVKLTFYPNVIQLKAQILTTRAGCGIIKVEVQFKINL